MVGPVDCSVDPRDTSESLHLFRTHEHIPEGWKIARAGESSILQLTSFLRYPVMDRYGSLAHPSEIFLLDDRLIWRWTLSGTDWSNQELLGMVRETRSPKWSEGLRAHPETVAWISFVCGVLSIGLTLVWLGFRGSR